MYLLLLSLDDFLQTQEKCHFILPFSFPDDPCSTRGTMSSSIDEKRSEPWANLLAGGVGGLACQVIGHPFDTVKVTLFRNISDVVFIGYVLYC